MDHLQYLKEWGEMPTKQPKDYGVSPTFNVTDLSPYDENGSNLKTSLFSQPWGIDTRVWIMIS